MAVVDAAENDGGAGGGGYVGWEEVYVCREKGKREIHYIMKRRDGGKDLAVIGKEKSLRHMTYRFLIGFNDDTKFSNSNSNSSSKPRSRRELLDWLNSFLPSDSLSPVSPQTSGGSSDVNETAEFDVEAMKDTQLQKVGVFTKRFLWIGSSWTCKKKRRHFKAFFRNGFKISVNEFVHVLAEDNRRLVAYLDDMYEDAKGNKMVVVRWFHKIDEVGLDDFNEKEIFFSLSVQDLNIECIDGLAMVLSALHYDKFLSVAKHTNLEPYVCNRQYDSDDVTPFDITQVKGYRKQEILKYMCSLSSSSKPLEKAHLPECSERKEVNCDGGGSKPRKRLRLSRDCKVDIPCSTPKDPSMETKGVAGQTQSNAIFDQRSTKGPRVTVLRIGMKVKGSQQVDSVVEVLSQDSGIRGCWFRATVIKRHKNKVKLSYHDIKDAEDQEKCLEEWVLSSRIAVRDDMGLRLHGRTTIRPSIPSHKGKISWAVNVGAVVDAWQHDGWWEGIVLEKQPNETFRVFFPGEKQEAVVGRNELRHSQEWVGNTWKELTERPDVAESILSGLVCNDKRKEESSANLKESNKVVLDLAKDNYLSQLKWKKRRRSCISVQKLRLRRSQVNSERTLSHSTIKFRIETSDTITKVDQDNCKYKNDHPLFSPPVCNTSTVINGPCHVQMMVPENSPHCPIKFQEFAELSPQILEIHNL